MGLGRRGVLPPTFRIYLPPDARMRTNVLAWGVLPADIGEFSQRALADGGDTSRDGFTLVARHSGNGEQRDGSRLELRDLLSAVESAS